MFSEIFVLAARETFWPLYLAALAIGLAASVKGKNATLARAVAALALGSLTQWVIDEGTTPLAWWQHMVIDVPIFAAVTVPPRSYWQSGLAALVGAQIVLHALWAIQPALAWVHYALCLYLGFGKVAVLLLWSGGRYVQTAYDWVSRGVANVVLAPMGAKRA